MLLDDCVYDRIFLGRNVQGDGDRLGEWANEIIAKHGGRKFWERAAAYLQARGFDRGDLENIVAGGECRFSCIHEIHHDAE